uniref:Carboxyl-terminal-processing peptidase 2ic-like n=1 Tax=Rhizophora mucronata TaxID=61149 RepID=A0A2P2LYX1_RHIMU
MDPWIPLIWPQKQSSYPFPKVGSPNNWARLLSFNAPANISLALAVPLFTNTASGSEVASAPLPSASYISRTPRLSQIYTITPLSNLNPSS